MKENMGKVPPVKVGEELKVVITAIGEKGDGIARISNFVVFVRDARLGEVLNVRIIKVLPKLAFATIIIDERGYEDALIAEERR